MRSRYTAVSASAVTVPFWRPCCGTSARIRTSTGSRPHVPATNPTQPPSVSAIDGSTLPVLVPPHCPRVTVWADDETHQATLGARLHTTASRVHATELAWLDRIRTTTLYAYRLPGQPFREWTEADGQWVSTELGSTAAGAASAVQ